MELVGFSHKLFSMKGQPACWKGRVEPRNYSQGHPISLA
jgi:hypothetical protein